MKTIKIFTALILLAAFSSAQADDKSLVDNLTKEMVYVLDDFGSYVKHVNKNILSEDLMNKKNRRKLLKQIPESSKRVYTLLSRIRDVEKDAFGISDPKVRETFLNGISGYITIMSYTRSALMNVEKSLRAKQYDESVSIVQEYYAKRSDMKPIYTKAAEDIASARHLAGLSYLVSVHLKDPKRSYLVIDAFKIYTITKDIEDKHKK